MRDERAGFVVQTTEQKSIQMAPAPQGKDPVEIRESCRAQWMAQSVRMDWLRGNKVAKTQSRNEHALDDDKVYRRHRAMPHEADAFDQQNAIARLIRGSVTEKASEDALQGLSALFA
jgi:hypothetical protein